MAPDHVLHKKRVTPDPDHAHVQEDTRHAQDRAQDHVKDVVHVLVTAARIRDPLLKTTEEAEEDFPDFRGEVFVAEEELTLEEVIIQDILMFLLVRFEDTNFREAEADRFLQRDDTR